MLYHYTDKDGWNAIRSQPTWRFKASQPRDPDRPFGVYLTSIDPSPENLRTLHKRLRVPRIKQEYVFEFVGVDGLTQLFGGRGRDHFIYYQAQAYEVTEDRQRYSGETQGWPGAIA